MAMCFRDRQFCNAPCFNSACCRQLNDKVREEARAWWGNLPGGAPIAMADMSKQCASFMPEPAEPAVA